MKAMSALRKEAIALIVILTGSLGGCAVRNFWNPVVWHAWLDPTRTIAVSSDRHMAVDIQHQVDDREQYWDIYPNAEPPTLEDLEWSDDDYTVGPGDWVIITIMDLYGDGQEAALRRRVSNEGNIHLPFIGQIGASGLSIYDLTDKIIRTYSPDYLLDPIISVLPDTQLENMFSITGIVRSPGRYPIARPEFRLQEAIAFAGDIQQQNIDYIYVVRQVDDAEAGAVKSDDSDTGTGENISKIEKVEDLPALPGDPKPETKQEPEKTQDTPVDAEDDLLKQLQQYMPQAETAEEKPEPKEPEAELAPVPLEPEPEVAKVEPAAQPEVEVTPETDKTIMPMPAPAAESLLDDLQANSPSADIAEEKADTNAELESLRELMGQPKSQPATRPIKPVEMLSYSAQPPATGMDPDDPFGWAQQDISGLARIIVVDLKRLQMGDPSQNIIIKDGDSIMVPPLPVGEFYVSGDVNRPGSYTLGGRKVTIKMALAAAGGFNAMAWPSNSVLVRRLDDNRELRIPLRLDKIMAGKAPEILLRPDDQIAVGSHIFSPFLAVLRNSFRMTYGMGFIFERNFAETNVGQYQSLDDAFKGGSVDPADG